jgi:hypothetical protein
MAAALLYRKQKRKPQNWGNGFHQFSLNYSLWLRSDCKDRYFLEHTEGAEWIFSRTVKAGITAIAEHCATIPSSVFPAGA